METDRIADKDHGAAWEKVVEPGVGDDHVEPEEEPWGARRRQNAGLYGQFSKFQVCFCGLDPGNLKFETVRTNKQHICFLDLRRSI